METSFTENSYEQAIISLFEEMGYRYEWGYGIGHDARNPLYEAVLEASLRRINPELSAYGIGELMDAVFPTFVLAPVACLMLPIIEGKTSRIDTKFPPCRW